MTDRVYALTVILESETRTDDLEPLIEAILQLRGVADVQPIVSDPAVWFAYTKARKVLVDALWKALDPKQWPPDAGSGEQ